MDDAVQAITMAFALMVFVMAMTISMMLIKQCISTSETLLKYSDLTSFYDNVQIEPGDEGVERIVGLDTVIPTLYRYYKENFCVKIYDATDGSAQGELMQIFDVNIETNLRSAIVNTNAGTNPSDYDLVRDEALKLVYNVTGTKYCLFGAPWLGSTETIKQRIDFFIHGKKGYINNTFVDYTGDESFAARIETYGRNVRFRERFISYSYSGSTMTTDDGETLINDEKNRDKIVINYIMIPPD